VQRIVAERPATRVLFISGYAQDPAFRASVLGRGAAFLGKPFQLEELAGKVREVLDAGAPGGAAAPAVTVKG
jgi:two-component system, cell cycle sensor histidine kinase and response regulator CckA